MSKNQERINGINARFDSKHKGKITISAKLLNCTRILTQSISNTAQAATQSIKSTFKASKNSRPQKSDILPEVRTNQSINGKVFSIMGRYAKFKNSQDFIDLLLDNGAYVINSPWYVIDTNDRDYPDQWTSCDLFIVGDKTIDPHEKQKHIKASKAYREGYPIQILTETEFFEHYKLDKKVPFDQRHVFGDTPITKTSVAGRHKASKQIIEKRVRMGKQQNSPTCTHCQTTMIKKKIKETSSTGQLGGCLLFFIGVLIFWTTLFTVIGPIIGSIIILMSFGLGFKQYKGWKCPNCGYHFAIK